MKTIVIIAQKPVWQQAQTEGQYTRSTIDSTLEEVGFIHGSFPDQTMEIIPRFKDRENVILLLVDAEKVTAPIKYEAASSGRPGIFPHIYGPLNTDAVYDVVEPEKGVDGAFIEPGQLKTSNREPESELSARLANAAQQVEVGARYMHYKQLSYTVLNLALREEDGEPCVIYQAAYGDHVIFIRPVASWLETVEADGKKMKRFTKITG